MIRIQQLKLDINHTESDLREKIQKQLKIKTEELQSYKIVKKSIDARNKSEIRFVYTIDARVSQEDKIIKKVRSANISLTVPKDYVFPSHGSRKLKNRPVIVGSGPAGLFAAYFLSKEGYRPILIEQGEPVDERIKTVNKFWEENTLNPDSNVQFGEGGAGTFSDGKLNTQVNDKYNRNTLVLETFVSHGAKPEILYVNKPHIGTDVLCDIVKNMRNEIISNGGNIRFNTKLTDLIIENGKITGILVNDSEKIECEAVILAIGHSARKTFRMLEKDNVSMQQKSFAVGLRIEHPQKMISISQYGQESYRQLPPAEYKLATKAPNGRNVFSFCMCPGGYVVNSSSEYGSLVVNGMSNSKRDSRNANSAIIVSVTEADFKNKAPLAGISFMEELEGRAYETGNGQIPVQLFKDFKSNKTSREFEGIPPCTKGDVKMANIRPILPEYISDAFIYGIHEFGKIIKGFDRDDCLLSAVETRTSSPVRILRDENFQSNIEGLYPCGEGAGYAGGITSAAMDGIKVFEVIAKEFTAF